MTSEHTRRAYHRQQRKSVDAALLVARWDQRGALPRNRPVTFIESVWMLLDGDTLQQFEAREQDLQDLSEPPQRQLGDFGGASA